MTTSGSVWRGVGAALLLATLIIRGPTWADDETGPGTGHAGSTPTPVTITGQIVEASCYLTKGLASLGPAHRDCAIRCIKEGRPPLVRDEVTGKLYLATFPDSTPAEREQWLRQIGTRVQVTGTVQEREGLRLLEVKQVRGEHDHEAAPHGGVVGMAGNRHIEVVADAGEPLRVYVLDEFMKPLGVGGMRGKAVIRGKRGPGRSSELVPDTKNESLRLTDATRKPDDEDITVTLDLDQGPLTMTLPFRDAGEAEAPGDGSSDAGHHADHHHPGAP